MATREGTVDAILDLVGPALPVTAKRMFGEHGLYLDGRMFALVCDDQLFIKPLPEAAAYIGEVIEGAPYPGAKPHLLIPGERWDEPDWLAGLFRIAAAAVPMPKPRKKRPA